MKTKFANIVMMIMALTTIAATAVADDAAIKKQLLGHWKTADNNIIVLKEDGTWDVRGGVYLVKINPNRTDEFKIISLTKSKLVIQDLYHGHGIGTWTRITTDG
jgi:uncharacterized protein (DUF2147 family)